MGNINLLCAADLHLGRYVEQPNQTSQRSCVIQAWEQLIEICLNNDVQIDALLLAGDLIDKEGLFIDMYGILRKGMAKLQNRNIPVIAIAGNHDARILDQLNHGVGLTGFHLLGANGEWERKTLIFNERILHIDGISFTNTSMLHNPLLSCKRQPVKEGESLIGLLHCDVDVTDSQYGPVKTNDFNSLPHKAWILGHIHQRRVINEQNPFVSYCGSLQGLDVSETGTRGAQLLTILPSGAINSKFIPLGPLRWEQVLIDLSEITQNDWEIQILRKIEENLVAKLDHREAIETIGVRLIFTGRTPIFRTLRRNLSKFQEQKEAGVYFKGRWILYFIESIKNQTLPARDLQRLSEGNDFIAVLSKKLLQIEALSELPHVMYMQLEENLRKDPYLKQCDQAWPQEKECLEIYLSQGYALLDELLADVGGAIDEYKL